MTAVTDCCSTDDKRESSVFGHDPRDRPETIYTEINPLAFVEFAPSRQTRESEHIVLQEHASPNAVRGRKPLTEPPKPRKRPTNDSIQYVEVQFSSRDPSLQPCRLAGGSGAKLGTNAEILGTAKSDLYENLLVRIPLRSTSSSASSPSPESSPPQTPAPFVKNERRGRNGTDDYEQFVLECNKTAAKDLEDTDTSQSTNNHTKDTVGFQPEPAQPRLGVTPPERPVVVPRRRPGAAPPVAPRPRPPVTPQSRPTVASRPRPPHPRPSVPLHSLVSPHQRAEVNTPLNHHQGPPPEPEDFAPESPVPERPPLPPPADSPPVPKRPPLPVSRGLPLFEHSTTVHHLPICSQSPKSRVSADIPAVTSGQVSVVPFSKASSDPGEDSRHNQSLRKSMSAPSLIPTKAAMLLGIKNEELVNMKDNNHSPSLESIPSHLKPANPTNVQYRININITRNQGSVSVPFDGDTFQLSYLGSQSVQRTYGILEGIATELISSSKDEGVETTVILDPSKVEIRPVLRKEGLTFAIEEIEAIDACTVAGVCVLGLVVVKDDVAMCHVFSAKDESTVLQFCLQLSHLFHSDPREWKMDDAVDCKYIGMVEVLKPHGVLTETITTLLHCNDPVHALPVQMTVNSSFVAYNNLGTSSALPDHYIIHKIEDVKALGLFDLDSRVFGYVVSTATGYNCHCFRCSSSSASTKIVQELRDAVQRAFRDKEQGTTSVVKKDERGTLGKFVSRLKRWGSSNKAPRSQSRFYTSLSGDAGSSPKDEDELCLQDRRPTSTFFTNMEPRSPDSMMSASVPSSPSSVESETTVMSPTKPQLFTAVYVGSSKTELPPNGQAVMDILTNMEKEGPRGGLAKDGKTIIQIRLAYQSVTLVDASEKVFFRRYYSSRAVVGIARHSYEKDIFGLWTCPGTQSEVKCHIFKRSMHSVSSIIHAFQQTFELECS